LKTPASGGAASPASARAAYIGVACTIIGAIGFSGKTVLVKLAYEHGIDPMTLLTLRMLMALPFFLAMAWWAGNAQALHRGDWLAILGLGFIGYYLGSYLDLAGLQYVSAGLGRLILFLYPTLVLIISAVLFKQAIRRRQLISIALSYCGIVLVFQSELRMERDLPTLLLGAALVFGGAVTYAIYLIAGSRMIQRMGAMRFTAYASITASVFVIATYFALRGAAPLAASREVYLITLVLAVFSTVLPLWLMAEGLKRIGANQVALVGCIGPLFTIGLADLILGEAVTLIQLTGAGLVLAGVLIISLRPQHTPDAKPRR